MKPSIVTARSTKLAEATYLFACIVHNPKDDSVVLRPSFFTGGRDNNKEDIDMLSYADGDQAFDYMILTNWMIFPLDKQHKFE